MGVWDVFKKFSLCSTIGGTFDVVRTNRSSSSSTLRWSREEGGAMCGRLEVEGALVKTGVGPVGGVVAVGRQLGGLCGRGLHNYGLTAACLCW